MFCDQATDSLHLKNKAYAQQMKGISVMNLTKLQPQSMRSQVQN